VGSWFVKHEDHERLSARVPVHHRFKKYSMKRRKKEEEK